jgi:hypothetical protein
MLTEIEQREGQIYLIPPEIPVSMTWGDLTVLCPYLWFYHIGSKLNPETPVNRGLRSAEQQQRFREHRQALQMLRQTLADEILNKMGDKEVVLLVNEYGYDNVLDALRRRGFEVVHYCLWSTKRDPLTAQEIEMVIRTSAPDWMDFCIGENPESFKSVPGLWHVQVFGLVSTSFEETTFQ